MRQESLNIAIAGLGTVGVGVAELLIKQSANLKKRSGCALNLVAVSSRDKSKIRDINLQNIRWFDDAIELTKQPDIDVIVELIGGSEGIAAELCERALAASKHVVTANKALIAHHGVRLAEIAEANGVQLQFEASVAGGIPIIKLIKEGLVANDYQKMIGILNGTCNYILSTMEQTGRSFADVLAEAQALGYAEADPAFDIDGIDAAHKLCILSAILFGTKPAISGLNCDGIRNITAEDIKYAKELGYTIRLIAATAKHDDKIELRVHPALLELGTPVSEVDGVYNAVHLFADAVGDVFIEGKGAGRYPTASAVVADIIDVARGNVTPAFLTPTKQLINADILPLDEHQSAHYLRMEVHDNSGVLASITKAFSDSNVSIARLIQHEMREAKAATIILTTHVTKERNIKNALKEINSHGDILLSPATLIRIEE
jgi:homoserine dehydrogenase